MLPKVAITMKQVPCNLLPYPVMPLKQTMALYLLSIRPFFTKEGFIKQQRLAMEFLHNKGYELQQLLEAAGQQEINWLADRWITSNYLRHRGPLTVFSSPCMSFPKQDFRNVIDFTHFTAQAIYGMCEFKYLVEHDLIPVHKMDEYDLDNSQFHNVFGTVRKPQKSCDTLEQCNSDYVIVIHQNNFHKLPVYTADERILNINELRNRLLGIVQGNQAMGPEIGLLTHDTRDNWADAYGALCSQEHNANVVQCIEEALFTVSLDEMVQLPSKGQERTLVAKQLLHGGGLNSNSANRWMDKTMQLIVNPNGMAGICMEHAPADPQPVVSIMNYVQSNITNPEYGNDSDIIGLVEQPHQLHFVELDQGIDLWLGAARSSINKISNRLEMEVFKFPCYGKCLIKSQGLSPDSFIQMALQLAFYRLHNELPAQYESAHLRIFKYGRTETIRSTSMKSMAFVTAMTSRNASLKQRLIALRAAVDGHQTQTKLAMRGHAVDRHLFGLLQMARENAMPLPEFFCSLGYLKSTQFRVLSAQIATSHDGFMACGPHTSEGYGCCYNPRENDIILAISSWNLKPQISALNYAKAIELALADMGQLILEAGGYCAAKAASDCKKEVKE
ncbi:carnitine O-acetyltransferase-like [Drosophila sulfurigaster albostrigata]|uniref:carnitine O-acetyltransferase-like n=1 Tax=Drosophila sulfurigaster albostrigata TaxID=89887 RepID=UPI002D21D485|nr:carnitine O-acetyltransferase-like [Drosophila sulfurigaster albostrigata]